MQRGTAAVAIGNRKPPDGGAAGAGATYRIHALLLALPDCALNFTWLQHEVWTELRELKLQMLALAMIGLLDALQ